MTRLFQKTGLFSRQSPRWVTVAAFFKQSFESKIKGDLIPEADAEEMIGEIQALFYRHNVAPLRHGRCR